MNRAQFKDPTSHMCLAGVVVACWFVAQEVVGSNTHFLQKYFYRFCRFYRIYLGKTLLHSGTLLQWFSAFSFTPKVLKLLFACTIGNIYKTSMNYN